MRLHSIYKRNRFGNLKRILLVIVCCGIVVNLVGCIPMDRRRFMGKMSVDSEEQSDAMIQLIVEALEKQDAEALKKLFSPYALEKAENLDEKIEELLEFYPGSEGGVEGDCISGGGFEYGKITLILRGTYKVISNSQEYQIRFVVIPRSDEEPEKTGLYLIEVMTEEAKQEGFKWRNEEDEPGVYVLEPQEL